MAGSPAARARTAQALAGERGAPVGASRSRRSWTLAAVTRVFPATSADSSWPVRRSASMRGRLTPSWRAASARSAVLALKGGARLEQIQLSLGHASIRTTERYLGVEQDLTDAPCARLGLRLS
jgi:hypothetical protein